MFSKKNYFLPSSKRDFLTYLEAVAEILAPAYDDPVKETP
jgi:hypothetical protein